MPPRLQPSAPTATNNMPSSRPWRRRSPARDERLPNGRSVPSLRSARQSELPGRRNVGKKERRGRRNVRKNANSVTGSGGNALERGRENAVTETGIAVETEIGQKSAVTETGTEIVIAIVTAERDFGQETAHEVAHGIIPETDTAAGGVSGMTAADAQKRSRSNFPKRSCLAWKRKLWLICYAIASVSRPSSQNSRLTRS